MRLTQSDWRDGFAKEHRSILARKESPEYEKARSPMTSVAGLRHCMQGDHPSPPDCYGATLSKSTMKVNRSVLASGCVSSIVLM